MPDSTKIRDLALQVIQIELDSINELRNRIGDNFIKACELLLHCKGRVIVTGMGKSGHIANKIAATLASTGTPAFFVHPAEAGHGDLGMITSNDVLLALSYSGETHEILLILPLIKRLGIPLITLCGEPQSTLACDAHVSLDVSVSKEACPLGLAPTSSTTAALVMGDALAIALLEASGFTAEDFAKAHPSGALGRRLLLRVEDVMRRGDAIPYVSEHAFLRDALIEASQKGLGMTTVVDSNHEVIGVFTDGDLRRAMDQNLDLRHTPIKQLMTPGGKRIATTALATEAVKKMEDELILCLLVANEQNHIVGIVHMHDLLRAKVL